MAGRGLLHFCEVGRDRLFLAVLSLKAPPSTSVKGRKWGGEIADTSRGTLGDVEVSLAQELPEQGFWPET